MSKKITKNKVAMARGKRLRFVRNITGMVGKVFGPFCGIGRTTISSWEQGGNLLTERGAEKVVRAVREEGIYCTTLWLLHGIGEAPQIVDPTKLSKLHYQVPVPSNAASIEEVAVSYNDHYLEKEMTVFRDNYSEHLITHIQDDTMYPHYKQGDWVGGIKLSQQAMDLAHGMDCIIQLKAGELLTRRAKVESLGALKISLYITNTELSVEYPPLRYIPVSQITALAPIVRIWRKNFLTDMEKMD